MNQSFFLLLVPGFEKQHCSALSSQLNTPNQRWIRKSIPPSSELLALLSFDSPSCRQLKVWISHHKKCSAWNEQVWIVFCTEQAHVISAPITSSIRKAMSPSLCLVHCPASRRPLGLPAAARSQCCDWSVAVFVRGLLCHIDQWQPVQRVGVCFVSNTSSSFNSLNMFVIHLY